MLIKLSDRLLLCCSLLPQEKIVFIGDIISKHFHQGEPTYYKEKLISLIF